MKRRSFRSSCPDLIRASTRLRLEQRSQARTVGTAWMAGTSPAMTTVRVCFCEFSNRF